MNQQKAEKQRPSNIKPDKRVIIYGDNLIDAKSIRVRPKHWRHPDHPYYSPFIIYTQWEHWKNNPSWLYLPEAYEKHKENILARIENEQDDKGNLKYKRLPYYIMRNRNNILTICFQNLRQLDFNKSTTVIFKGGKMDEDGKWIRESLPENSEIPQNKEHFLNWLYYWFSEIISPAAVAEYGQAIVNGIKTQMGDISVKIDNLRKYNDDQFKKWFTDFKNDPGTQEHAKKYFKVGGKMKDEPALFFIDNWDYADNDKLLIQANCTKDNIWTNTPIYYDSPGYGTITKSFLGHEHQKHTRGIKWMENPELEEGATRFNQIIQDCSACNDCFDFCDLLSNKRAVSGGFSKVQYPQWQPTFKFIYTYLSNIAPKVNPFDLKGMNPETGKMEVIVNDVPNNLYLDRWSGQHSLRDFWDNGTPALLYLVDGHQNSNSPFSAEDNSKRDYWHELPSIYNEQPHLLNHSTVQFYFQRKLLFTANGRHLAIGRKVTPNSPRVNFPEHGLNNVIRPIYVLHYKVYINSSIAGILYTFQSGDIYYRWELEVRGSILNQTVLSKTVKAVLVSTMRNLGGSLLEMGGSIPFVGGLFKATGKAVKGGKEGGGKGSLGELFLGEKLEKVTGSQAAKGKNEDKKTEQHTERKGKSTVKNREYTVAPSLYATDTIDFNYDIYEFANRAQCLPFEVRFEHSETFFNNLWNNDNLATAPNKQISTPFRYFRQLLTPGFIQGEIDLDEDTQDGFFSQLISRGIVFINDKKEFFTHFKYKYRGLMSYQAKKIAAVDHKQGDEIVEKIERKVEEKLDNSDFNSNTAQAGYSTYFRVPDNQLFKEMAVGRFSSHWTGVGQATSDSNKQFSDGKNMVCWGCGLDRTRQHRATVETGGELYIYFDTGWPSERLVEIPEGSTVIIDPIVGEIRAEFLTTEYKYSFKAERVDADRDEVFLQEDYKDDTTEPTNTSAEVELELENDDDREEVDPDDLDFEGAEQEGDEQEEPEIDSEFQEVDEEQAEQEEEDDWESDHEDDEDEESDTEDDDEIEDDTEEEHESDNEDADQQDTDRG